MDVTAKELEKIQQQQKKFYDRNRTTTQLEKDDLVLLDREGIAVGSSYSLPFIGPFKILERCENSNYKLELPDTMRRLHPEFHISKLRKYEEPTHGLQKRRLRPLPDVIDGDEEYEVQSILKQRYFKGHKEYLVRWKGYDASEDSWENGNELRRHANDIVNEYELAASPIPKRKTTPPKPKQKTAPPRRSKRPQR